MEYVGAVLTSIGLLKDFWPSISKCFNYGKILEENRTSLREQMERLKSRETDVKRELENAQYHRKRAREEVENWLKEVQTMKDGVERMEKQVAKRRCFSRSGFLREWEENIERARELVERAGFPNGILIDAEDEGMALPTKEIFGESTAKRNLEKIWTSLEEGEAQSIGVWGMGGIGKTTLVTHINNRLLENKDAFGVVYWVTVAKDSSIRRLQDAISEKINLKDFSNEEDEMIRRARLFEKLQRMGKFVLIFDDMWEVYRPEEIGIPIGANAEKLIITSRLRDVCQKIGCEEIIKVDSLHEKEAWELFNKMLKRHVALSPEEEEIAKDVVKECAGLPLAIVTTARSLSVAYDIAEWRNALIELREHVKGHTIDRENDVFKILEFSYQRLNDDKLRECLLYCALFPEDFKIRRMSLIKYWIVEGLIEEMGSRRAECDRGHAILNKLENACLLERCEDGKAVKMHDVIRDMAINITRNKSRFLVKTRTNWEDLPGEIVWSSNLERVSFFQSNLSSLMMFEPKCPKLSTMFLQSLLSVDVPRSFFLHMPGLIVLDLSYTDLHFLPESVYDLVNLRALILCGCRNLKHVGSLAKLKELRMLDLSDNEIETFPDGIEILIYLKQFNWTSYALEKRQRHHQIFPHGAKSKESLQEFLDSLPKVALSKILFNLVHLQCLKLLDGRVRDLEAEELRKLTKLEILCTRFASLHNFNSYIRTQHYCRLTHYYVHLAEPGTLWPPGMLLKRHCKQLRVSGLNLKEGKEDNDGYQLVLPANLQALELEGCHLPASLRDVSPSLKEMMDLEVCRIEDCTGSKYLCRVEDWIASLSTLYIENLTSLRALFEQERTDIGRNYCWNLKHLEVKNCDNLKYLFTDGLVKYHLQNLETLVIAYCDKMEGIIAAAAAKEEEEEEEEEEEILSLPKLQRLQLDSLPYLKSIWKGTMKCDSLQELVITECPELTRLPIFVHISPGDDDDEERRPSNPPLEQILGEEEWWNRVEWDTHPGAKSLFQPLFLHVPRGFRIFSTSPYRSLEEIELEEM